MTHVLSINARSRRPVSWVNGFIEGFACGARTLSCSVKKGVFFFLSRSLSHFVFAFVFMFQNENVVSKERGLF